jgi:hypothetical protein
MLLAFVLLKVLASRTAILSPVGTELIRHAQLLEKGAWRDGVVGSVDHPVYPLAIAGAHALRGGDGPEAWQTAAQLASLLAGVLLVIPLYLVANELFGPRPAWLAVYLFLLAPRVGPILADVLSEGTFLLFWCSGLYAALRFLRKGSFGWLPLVLVFGGLAYLTRPEGLLLPTALVASLLLIPLLRSTRLNWPRWWVAVGLMVLGSVLVVGPYVAVRGGIATRPAVARLLGLLPRSPADAIERARPLPPDQSELETYAEGLKAVGESVRDLVTPWLLPLAVVGLIGAFRPLAPRARVALMLGLILAASLVALVRLYATCGYCSPRHVLAPGLVLIAAAAFGLQRLLGAVSISGRSLGLGEGRFTAGPAVWCLVLAAYTAASVPTLVRPINQPMVGYRDAGAWLATQSAAPGAVADATGWSMFYSQRPGHTFATLGEAPADDQIRWVVVRQAHLVGPWWYCQIFRDLVGRREPVAVFPSELKPDESRVLVFDRRAPEVRQISWQGETSRRR